MESAATRRDFLASGAAVSVPLAARSASSKSGAAARAGLLAGKRAVIYGAAGSMGESSMSISNACLPTFSMNSGICSCV